MSGTKKIAVNTGGGDAPGLNAVIRAIVLSALNRGWEVFGIRRGYQGILSGDPQGVVPLDRSSVRGITHLGGTILGTTNRGNPFCWPRELPDGSTQEVDRSDEILDYFREHGLDALLAIGGDGSLHIARDLHRKGLPVVGVPKTIDNDLAATQETFGFQTAVQTASDAIDKLHSTAESHGRTMVVELMGRHTGWIALFAGLSGTADVILIPEIPFTIEKVVEKIRSRYEGGAGFAIVVVAEGAKPRGGQATYRSEGRLGGIGEAVASEIARIAGVETRSLVLGHLQRGGQPMAHDRILALRFGAAAVNLVENGRFGSMVALHPPDVTPVALEEAVEKLKVVPVDGDVVSTARSLGVSFGD